MLSPDDSTRLARLLASAVSVAELERYVWQATGDRLFVEYADMHLPLRPAIEQLLAALERDGTTEWLARVVYREKPQRGDVRAALRAAFPDLTRADTTTTASFDVQSAGAPHPEVPGNGGPALRRLVRPNLAQIDLKAWVQRLERVMAQVGRIESNGRPFGTGFLVGDGLVLTNWHVVDFARKAGAADKLAVRFDYHRLPDGTEAGTEFPVERVVDERPCAPGEMGTRPDDPPAADELDYALLRLSESTAERGWQTLRPGPPLGPDAPIIIVQHPQGEPMKMALDDNALIGPVHKGLRLRYRTNTQPGSSGSPVFDWDLNLVGLHHLGDPALNDPAYNQAVPVGLVAQSIATRAPGVLPP